MHHKICGIDPGVSPAMALFDTADNSFAFNDTLSIMMKRGKGNHAEPQPALIRAQLLAWQPDLVIIEKVQPRGTRDGRKQGLASTAAFMRARGMLEGIC